MSWFHHLFLPHHSNNQRAKILHSSSLGLIVGLFVLFQLGLSQASSRFPGILGYASQISPSEVARLTNLERSAVGAPEVKLNDQLNIAAAQKAADMTARDYWAHVSPLGTQPWFFITQAGYSYRYAGENLARDFSDPKGVVTAWMNSPSHKENLLNPKYEDMGIAVIDGMLGGRETTLVVQMFGTQLSGPPAVAKTTTFTVTAQAAETSPAVSPTIQPTVTPEPLSIGITQDSSPPSAVSPFSVTRLLAQSLLGILFLVLLIDVSFISRKKIVRWTSKSLAHLMFITMILIAMFTVIRGQVL